LLATAVPLFTCAITAMGKWRFFQGLRNEWRWYQLDANGSVTSASDSAFAELPACMANAERAGFTHSNYQVHARRTARVAPDPKIDVLHVPLR
jgi:hypothetical protein